MVTKKTTFDYQAASAELETILVALQTGELDIEVAVKQYERGLELVTALEAYLKTAENRVTKLKAQFTDLKGE